MLTSEDCECQYCHRECGSSSDRRTHEDECKYAEIQSDLVWKRVCALRRWSEMTKTVALRVVINGIHHHIFYSYCSDAGVFCRLSEPPKKCECMENGKRECWIRTQTFSKEETIVSQLKLTRHHRKQKVFGGKSNKRNISYIPQGKHRAWTLLFDGCIPECIANLISAVYLDPDWEMIARKREGSDSDISQWHFAVT